MKIVIDQESLNRRARLSHIASLGGLLVLLGSVLVSLLKPEWIILVTVMLFGWGIVSIIGIFYANRWVKKPRPENVLNESLKVLDDRAYIFHYLPLCDHLLILPHGLVVIETCNLEGKFTYKGGKWKQNISLSRATRFFLEEKLGDPIARAEAYASTLKSITKDVLGDSLAFDVYPLVVFTNPLAQINVINPPIPVILPRELPRRLPKNKNKVKIEAHRSIRDYFLNVSKQDFRDINVHAK
jgi:hypothetical protein